MKYIRESNKAIKNENVCGGWCLRRNILCVYRTDNGMGWLPRRDGNVCNGMFFGTCTRGNRYIPWNSDQTKRQMTIKQASDFNEVWYESLIGETFDIVAEMADTVFVDATRCGLDLPASIYRIDGIITIGKAK